MVPSEHGTCYLYGHEETYSLNEVNVPMLIQIRDHANIMLFDMINAMGGKLAVRNLATAWASKATCWGWTSAAVQADTGKLLTAC